MSRILRVIIGTFLVVFFGVAFLVITMPFWMGWLMQSAMEKNYNAVSKVTLACPPETSQVIERWSQVGHSVFCQTNEVKEGPWQAWSGGHLSMSGHYVKDKLDGPFLVFTDDGKQLYRTIIYDNGRELSDDLKEQPASQTGNRGGSE